MSAADLPAPRRRTAESAARRAGRAAPWLAQGCLVVLVLAPVVPMVLWSFGRGWFYPALLPDFDLSAWRYAVSEVSGMLHALVLSIGVALAATALSLVVGVPAGRALGLHRFRGRGAVEALVLAPVAVPAIAIAMGLHALFLKLGLVGTIAGVVLVHLVPTLPYTVLVAAAAFANHDPAFEEQARMLGAGRLATFRAVTLPMLAPGIAVAAALAFLVSWSQYALTLLIGSGRVVTLPLILTQFAGAGRMDVAGVAAILTVLPGALVLAAASRHLSRLRPDRARGRDAVR